jgi:hypothetical protein
LSGTGNRAKQAPMMKRTWPEAIGETEACANAAVTRDGRTLQWAVVHVAGNGDWRYDVHPGRAEACEASDRRGNAPSGSEFQVAKIRTACHPGDRGMWGSGPAPAGDPEMGGGSLVHETD